MVDLSRLNTPQHQAVTAPDGPVLVLAGPGSGKTRVLTLRIAYLVGARDIPPDRLLAVTFTNKAARAMEERVNQMLGGGGRSLEGIWMGTFHAMCARLLRREARDHLAIKSNFVIMDSDDQESLVRRILKEMNVSDKAVKPASVHASISSAKNELLDPEDYPNSNYRDQIVRRAYQRYQQLLQENNAVDFDDLLLLTVRLLQGNETIRNYYARRFEHVLVDEFQDTNTAQYELVRLLSSKHKNLFVVGDEDQSIYRWRGADFRNVLRFEQDYPGCTKVLLEQNYRSTQTVLDAARAVIDKNRDRTRKALFSDRGAGEPIQFHEAVDDRAEAQFVVDTILGLVTSARAKAGDFAVMYRTNAQSRLLEEAFLRSGQPYRLVGAQRFYGRREVKDLIAYLRLALNPDDELSLVRAVAVPPRGIGEKTLDTLRAAAAQNRTSPGQALISLGTLGEESPFWGAFRGRGAALLADFGGQLAGWASAADSIPLPILFDRIVDEIAYREYILDESEEGQDRWENVQELRRIAYEYESRGLAAFLENLALVSDQDTVPENQEAPTLLTLHAAKGLEFPQVFIVGLDEGILPHSRSRDDPEEMAEERRLFYVGLTRAKDRLYLVRALRRSSYGSFEDSLPSRFVEDIPAKLLKHSGQRRTSYTSAGDTGRVGRRYDPQDYTWAANTVRGLPPAPSKPAAQQRYQANDRVRHPVWGEGLVVESRLMDGDENVDVFFDSVGFKRLVASLANLEIIQK